MTRVTPSDYGIPHEHWRQYQYETVRWLEENEGAGVLICEQPTGSGKSAIAISPAVRRKTIILTHTKNLQVAYGDIYGASVLMGKGNYECVNLEGHEFCDDCIYRENMYKCPVSMDCLYMLAKKRALSSRLASLNYAYWLTTKSFSRGTEFLALDEAHLLSDITLNWAGATINEPTRREWELPALPTIRAASKTSVQEMHQWFVEAGGAVGMVVAELTQQSDQDRTNNALLKQRKRAENLLRKITSTGLAIEQCAEAWYVKSGPGVCYLRGRPVPGLVVRPLTARYHWPHLFLGDYDVLLMSATIGNMDVLANELGIREHTDRVVPSRFTPEQRPVFALDAPRMGHRSKPSDYDRQAEVIAEAILSCPSDWSGFIHITRKGEAEHLSRRLTRYGLGGRIWTPPQKQGNRFIGTDTQAILWEEHRRKHPGAICISWQFWEGMDGLDEKISIIAKVPFPFIGDPYERARMSYSQQMFSQRTAWKLMQAAGRTRRGRPQDYDIDGRNGLVCIADGNWTRIRKYLSPEFLSSIMPWEGG